MLITNSHTDNPTHRPRTLGHRLILTNVALVVVIMIMGAASLWGLIGLRDSVLDVVNEYDEVRMIGGAKLNMMTAQSDLAVPPVNRSRVRLHIDETRKWIEAFQSFQRLDDEQDSTHQDKEETIAIDLSANLKLISDSIARFHSEQLTHSATGPLATRFQSIMGELAEFEADTDIEQTRQTATDDVQNTIIAMSILALVLLSGAITVSAVGYRKVMKQVHHFQAGVRHIAKGNFRERLDLEGYREIDELAQDFNQMATELDTLYRMMEDRIAQKSRELVRSERLASVGFLAAGVAHEINNPLSIITGYSEMAQKWLWGDATATRSAKRWKRSTLFVRRPSAVRGSPNNYFPFPVLGLLIRLLYH